MSRREDNVKAAAAGLQPKSLGLTDIAPARAANRVRSTQRVANDLAGYALGFASGEIEVGGERMPGDPLAVTLLRLKYAEQLSLRMFERALDLLLHRHARADRRFSETVRAVAAAALVEWLNDRCPECRSPRERVRVSSCPECRPSLAGSRLPYRAEYDEPWRDPWGALYLDRAGEPIRRVRASTSPAPGCRRCGGLGRVFQEPPRPRGVVCSACGNSGVVKWKAARRGRAVSELLAQAQRSRGEAPRGLPMKAFTHGWHRQYHDFLDALRAADRRVGLTIDFRFAPNDRSALERLDAPADSGSNSGVESGIEEKQNGGDPIGLPDASSVP